MSKKRQDAIIKIIESRDVETQQQLAKLLMEQGFSVTQATVSRDIKKLKLSKVPAGSGHQKYVLFHADEKHLSSKYVNVLKEGFVSMDMAQNILIVKTVSGMAMAVAASIDAMHWSEVAGCIAGDDTIMCAIRSAEDTVHVMDKINRIVNA